MISGGRGVDSSSVIVRTRADSLRRTSPDFHRGVAISLFCHSLLFCHCEQSVAILFFEIASSSASGGFLTMTFIEFLIIPTTFRMITRNQLIILLYGKMLIKEKDSIVVFNRVTCSLRGENKKEETNEKVI